MPRILRHISIVYNIQKVHSETKSVYDCSVQVGSSIASVTQFRRMMIIDIVSKAVLFIIASATIVIYSFTLKILLRVSSKGQPSTLFSSFSSLSISVTFIIRSFCLHTSFIQKVFLLPLISASLQITDSSMSCLLSFLKVNCLSSCYKYIGSLSALQAFFYFLLYSIRAFSSFVLSRLARLFILLS